MRYRRVRPWKYQLLEDVELELPGRWPSIRIAGGLVNLVDYRNPDRGVLTIAAGYSWDGPSGPTFDTENFMRASLVHDALYQLMRSGRLPMDRRPVADALLRDLAREDGMSRLRSWWVWRSVRLFGRKNALPPLPA
jgi:hypothetical protein